MKLPRPLQISFVFWPLALGLAFFLLPSAFFLLSAPPALAAADCSLPQCQTGRTGIAQNGAVRGCDGLTPTGKYQCSSGTWVKVDDSLPESGNAAYSSKYAKWYRKDPVTLEKEKFDAPDNEVTAPKFAASQFNYTLAEFAGQTALTRDSALAGVGRAIAFMTTNAPVKSDEYFKYLAQKSGLVQPAYAANDRGGFDLLKPVQKIWIATRNVAYLIVSLTLVVIGFMIMLRKKIDAQTVIGIQQALPKLVVTLLLITFSYAIAGFLIDMIYFLIYFMVNLAITFDVYTAGGNPGIKEILTNRSAVGIIIREIWWSTEGTSVFTSIFQDVIKTIGGEGVIEGSAASLSGWMSQPLVWVIITGALLFAAFKLFFTLLMAYIQIIVSVIVGPIQLTLNALPGSDAFSKWFRNLLANAMAFPATAAMFLFGGALMGLTDTWGVAKGIGFKEYTVGGFIPPYIGISGDVAGGANAVMGLIGLGIILMTPKVVDMVKEWVQAPEFKYGSAIGEAVGFGGKAPGFLTGAGSGEIEYLRGLQKSGGAGGKAYMRSLMFTNPELYKRISDAQAGGLPGKIIHGLRYAVRSGSGK